MEFASKEHEAAVKRIVRRAQLEIRHMTGQLNLMLLLYKGISDKKNPREMMGIIAASLDMKISDYKVKSRLPSYVLLKRVAAMLLMVNYHNLGVAQISKLLCCHHSNVIEHLKVGNDFLDVSDASFVPHYEKAQAAVTKWLNEDE